MPNPKNHNCDICGRNGASYFASKLGMYLCPKHYQQFYKFGYIKDSNQRTINDLNDIHIDGKDDIAYIDLYDTCGNVIAQSIIDASDVELVKDIKWRTTKKKRKIYVISGKNHDQQYLARFLLNYDGPLEVDHIDGNELNNQRNNLRIVDRQENLMNLKVKCISKTQIRGVSYDEMHKTFNVDFSYIKNRFYFKPFKTIEEAVYLRYLCEITYQKEFRNTSNDQKILGYITELTSKQKDEIKEYFNMKIASKIINVA